MTNREDTLWKAFAIFAVTLFASFVVSIALGASDPGNFAFTDPPSTPPQREQVNTLPIRWLTSTTDARREAARTGQPVLIHWSGPGCEPCRRFERDVLTDPEVVATLSAGVIVCHVDTSTVSIDALRAWGIGSIPADTMVDADWRQWFQIKNNGGAWTAAEYAATVQASIERIRKSVPRASAEVYRTTVSQARPARVYYDYGGPSCCSNGSCPTCGY